MRAYPTRTNTQVGNAKQSGPLVNTPKKGNSGARVDLVLKHLLQEQYRKGRNDRECDRLRTHSAQGTLVKPQAEHARPRAR